MDPLAIGATDDESKKRRDTLELEIPSRNLIAHVLPDEPAPIADATAAAREALASPVHGPSFAEILAGKASVAVIVDNQFRPTPSSKLLPPVFDAIEAAGIADARVSSRTTRATPTPTPSSASRRAEPRSGCTTRWLAPTSRSRSARRRRTTGARAEAGS
jgi:hypothetical protein